MADSLTNLLARFDSEFKSECDDLKAVREERNFASRSSVRQYGLPAFEFLSTTMGIALFNTKVLADWKKSEKFDFQPANLFADIQRSMNYMLVLRSMLPVKLKLNDRESQLLALQLKHREPLGTYRTATKFHTRSAGMDHCNQILQFDSNSFQC